MYCNKNVGVRNVKRNCRPQKHGILIEIFDLNTAFMYKSGCSESICSSFLLVLCEHYGKCFSEIVLKLPQYWVWIQQDFEIVIWFIPNAMLILFLEMQIIPNSFQTSFFVLILDYSWQKRPKWSISLCGGSRFRYIFFFFHRYQSLKFWACRQTR